MTSYEIEGCDVFALLIKVGDEDIAQLWGIYSNAKACQDRSEEIVRCFKFGGIDAKYCCRSYTVKEF